MKKEKLRELFDMVGEMRKYMGKVEEKIMGMVEEEDREKENERLKADKENEIIGISPSFID